MVNTTFTLTHTVSIGLLKVKNHIYGSILASFGVFFLYSSAAYCQNAPNREIMKAVNPGYFLFPIRPGEQNSLSGSLGDLRSNHFHAGLDIRTEQREGLDVYAAADGYVSRIAVFTGGYGNVVFIKHPNGLTTVYGHLKILNDTLGYYLRREQYKQQTFEIDLQTAPNQFPIKKGEVIALSGNTGGSGGPHLHFEIRDEANNLLNPLLFGFQEIEDTLPPFLEKIALQPLTPSTRVNGQASRLVLTPIRRPNGDYVLSQPITATGLLGLEILAYDRINGSPFNNGLSCIEIQLDDQEVFAYNMDSFPNEQTRLINLHMNYGIEQLTGQRFHRCYLADGNLLNLYRFGASTVSGHRGKLPLFDGKPHEVSIILYDSFQHACKLQFTIQPEPQETPFSPGIRPTKKLSTAISSTVEENTLIIRAQNFISPVLPPAELYLNGGFVTLPLSYTLDNKAYYIVDLTKYLPDSVRIGKTVQQLNYKKSIIPGTEISYKDSIISLEFSEKSLYDTLHLAINYLGNRFSISEFTIPLNDQIKVRFLPIDPIENPQRTHVYQIRNGRRRYVGGYWKDSCIHFRTQALGTFQLLTDIKPPVVQLLRKDANALVATIRDDLSGIDTFRASVNGEWVLMQYDYKRNLIWSDKLDPTKPFEGPVIIEVNDRAGNVTTVTGTIPPASTLTSSRTNH